MAEFLLELRSEEIPARMQVRAGADLEKLLTKALGEAGLEASNVRIFTGPRRLVLVADVPARSPDVREERKGPRVGSPEQALAGFMRAAGLSDISEAEVREDKKGQQYVAVIEKAGRDASAIIADAVPAVMRDFPWPKSMRSGASDFRWVRPLRGIVALLDGAVVAFEVGGINSGNTTEGHRQHGPGPYTVSSFADYREQLEGPGHLLLDHAERMARIRDGAAEVTGELALVADEALLHENAGLTEWPVTLLGDMDEKFLELPEEVIRLTLKSHQKTFTVRRKDGRLAPHFLIVANLDAPDGGETIRAGNRKVIEARLSDAAFFIETDAKTTLAEHAEGLSRVVFHDKLGSFADKVERVAALAREIAPMVGADPDVAEAAARLAKADLVTGTVIEMTSLQGQIGRMMAEREIAETGRLAVPGPVPGPSTSGDASDKTIAAPAQGRGQGIYLNEEDGLKAALAIEEHYKPQGPSDAVPTAPVSVAVALADKLDSLVAFWAIDEKPTGSKDPYALRRAALGVVRLILGQQVVLPMTKIIRSSHRELVRKSFSPNNGGINFWGQGWNEAHSDDEQPVVKPHFELSDYQSSEAESKYEVMSIFPETAAQEVVLDKASTVANSLGDFILDRLRVYLRDQGHRHDVIDAVLAQGGDDLLAISKRVEALGALLGTEEGENLVQGYKRAANILRAEKKKGWSQTDEARSLHASVARAPAHQGRGRGYTAPEAEVLADALGAARPGIDAALEAGDYGQALETLAGLRGAIDAFFEGVMVNADDADARERRLGLLAAIVETFERIADFGKLEG